MKQADSGRDTPPERPGNIFFICTWCALAALVIVVLAGTVVPLAGCESGGQGEAEEPSSESSESGDEGLISRVEAGELEDKAVGMLKSLGSSQLAYQSVENHSRYGTFTNLQNDLYIEEGYSPDALIDKYNLLWEIDYPLFTNQFTVISYPRDTRTGFLNTFGITEDQVERVFNPDNGNEWEDVHSWDPVTEESNENYNRFTIVALPDEGYGEYLRTFAITEDQVLRVYTPENDNELLDVYNWDPIL